MRKFIVYYCCLLITLSGCKNKNAKVEIPPTILEQDKVVSILVDIHLEEAKLNTLHDIPKSPLAADTINFTAVFKKHAVKKSTFDSSMLFYTQHPKLLDETYDKVINIISNDKIKAEKKK